MDKHTEMLGKIKSREDFLEFMSFFITATQDVSLKNYVEALAAWAADMDGYYNNCGKEVPTDINWDFIATLLYTGSIYE